MGMQAYFFVRKDKKYIRVNHRDVIYIESVGNYAKIVMDKGILLTIATIKELERTLPVELFCRINRGCIVAVERIISFTRDTVHLKNMELVLSSRCRKGLENKIVIIPSTVTSIHHSLVKMI